MPRVKNSSYNCPVLNTTVTLELTYASIPGIVETLSGFNCKNACVECGVVTESGLSRKYNWEVCPAHGNIT